MSLRPLPQLPAAKNWPGLEQMGEPILRVLADFVHGSYEEPACRTVAATALVTSLWQLTGRRMTHRVPSLLLVSTGDSAPDPIDEFAADLIGASEDNGPRVHEDGPFMHGTPELAPKAMLNAFLEHRERRKLVAQFPWVAGELQALEHRYFAAERTGFGFGRARPYASAWHDTFGLLTCGSREVILRLGSADDHARFREHLLGDPDRLQAARGYGRGLMEVSKSISLSGAIDSDEWDGELAVGAVGLGLPLLFLPNPARKPPVIRNRPAIEFMTAMLPRAFSNPLEEPANLVPAQWFAHYEDRLRIRLRQFSGDYDYVMHRMARQLFPVCLRLTSWAGQTSGATAEECEALALDLCAHALRGQVISIAGLAWHGIGLDAGCPHEEVVRVLDYLRVRGPMTVADLRRRTHLDSKLRDVLVERFLEEDLVRLDGKRVTALTYPEFVDALYARDEFPEPPNHWADVDGKGEA